MGQGCSMSFYRIALLLLHVSISSLAFVPNAFFLYDPISHSHSVRKSAARSYRSHRSTDILPFKESYKPVTTDSSNDDTDNDVIALIQELKRELLILSSITNRGLYTLSEDDDEEDEDTLMEDLISQLETFHPMILASYKSSSIDTLTPRIQTNPDSATIRQFELLCHGNWDLIMTSSSSTADAFASFLGLGKLDLDTMITQTLSNIRPITQNTPTFLKDITSSLFQSSNLVLSNVLKSGGGFIHPSSIGRVRQCIKPIPDSQNVHISNQIHIHFPPLFPFQSFGTDKQRIQGISVSTQGISSSSSSMRYKSSSSNTRELVGEWTLKPTQVQIRLLQKHTKGWKERQNSKSSSSSFFSLFNNPLSIPLNSTTFSPPVAFMGIKMQTTFLDDEIRITRDSDHHFYVWSRN